MTLDTAPNVSEDAMVLATVEAFVEAVNTGNQAGALHYLAPDVTIVEDLPPYRWHGPHAGEEWMAAMWQNAQRTGLTDIAMELGSDSRIEIEGDGAYVVVPARLTLSDRSRCLAAQGLLTFALRRAKDLWQIAAFTWSAPEPS